LQVCNLISSEEKNTEKTNKNKLTKPQKRNNKAHSVLPAAAAAAASFDPFPLPVR